MTESDQASTFTSRAQRRADCLWAALRIRRQQSTEEPGEPPADDQ
ncbi:hypothetical protein ABIE44_001539 [Marmoricola sp. OAE513]